MLLLEQDTMNSVGFLSLFWSSNFSVASIFSYEDMVENFFRISKFDRHFSKIDSVNTVRHFQDCRGNASIGDEFLGSFATSFIIKLINDLFSNF